MSVTGLIISLGLLIDNAIVAVEAYKQGRRDGMPIDAAVRAAVEHLFVPLFAASTATTVFAFIPIALTPGERGIHRDHCHQCCPRRDQQLFPGHDHRASAGWLSRSRLAPMAADLPRWRRKASPSRPSGPLRREPARRVARPLKGVAVSLLLPVLGFALAPTLTQQFFLSGGPKPVPDSAVLAIRYAH